MAAEIAALAGVGAASVVQLVVNEGFAWTKERIRSLLRTGEAAGEQDPGQGGSEGAREAEVDRLLGELADAQHRGDADALDAAEEALTAWLQELLARHPQAEPRLRALTGPFTGHRPAATVSSAFLHYVNNEPAFQRMDAHWARCREAAAVTVFFLSGLPGVGKRTTARRWLHTHADVFTDEPLHADLAVTEPARRADPAAVLERWLDQLGVRREERPADVADKADLVRRTVRERGRPFAVLLENVTTTAQLRPLLPDSPHAVVLITGQTEPPGLHQVLDAEAVRLGPLTEQHALELLCRVSRSTEDPETFRPLLSYVGGLPLALRLLAGHLRTPGPGGVADVLEQLTDRAGRQELLRPADDSLTRAFDLGYAGLDAGAARLYRSLGLHPRVEVQLDAVYALLPERDPAAVRRDLRALLVAGLVERWGVDAYLLHPYVHDHAAERAEREDPEAERAATEGRIVTHYRDLAERAEAALSGRWRHDPMGSYAARQRPAPGADPERDLVRRRAALLAAVHLAARTGRHEDAWRLCQGLWTVQLRTGSHAEWIESRRIGWESARTSGDRMAEARMRFEWGFGHLDRWSVAEGDPARAREHLTEALRLTGLDATGVDGPATAAQAEGDPGEGERRTASSALEALGLLELKLRRPELALDRFDQALAALGGLPHPRGRALLDLHRSRALSALNRHNDAERTLARARAEFDRLGDSFNLGKTWLRYAEDRHACGQPAAALEASGRAADCLRSAGNDYFQAVALLLKGDILRELGRPAGAEWTAARDLFEQAGSSRAEEARARLAAE
ncbi:hypothetical protein [Streptomyces sp. NK08204]|uniref:hypothetical protein n=1 Tax=Streptomyces sp. NK08204 TaxID=2873260 RepID=UPI001CED95FC|nr:hypothetical protein [Streptomyces sp. NK08204]